MPKYFTCVVGYICIPIVQFIKVFGGIRAISCPFLMKRHWVFLAFNKRPLVRKDDLTFCNAFSLAISLSRFSMVSAWRNWVSSAYCIKVHVSTFLARSLTYIWRIKLARELSPAKLQNLFLLL